LTDPFERFSGDADERLARHLATARRQMQRDEMGRIVGRLPSPLAAWEEPKRQPGQSARHGGGRNQFFSVRLPVRAYAALRTLAERRGVTLTYLVHEALASVLQPVLAAPSPSLADRPLDVAQPHRMHRRREPVPAPHAGTGRGFLTDTR
jgi:hypothetical protein